MSVTGNMEEKTMPRGGKRSTTWESPWRNGRTKLVRVPEALTQEILAYALQLDKGEAPPVTDKNEAALKEAADSFLMTIRPRDRRRAKRLLYKFIESIDN
jgi:hypothetical protein